MKMTTYLGILALGILLATLAHADQPGPYPYPQQEPQYYPQQGCVRCAPLPQPIDQSIFCPPNARNIAPPVLPYPGPQVRMVPAPRGFGGACSLRPAGRGFYEIVLNGVQPLYSGYGPNVQAVLMHYQRIGVCRQIF